MAGNFVLMTDDNCDLPYDFYEKNDIAYFKMPFIIDGATLYGGDMQPQEFYDFLRQGKTASTAAGNVEELGSMMEPFLKAGKDVLYLAFSSGLSSTARNGQMAADALSEQYPERKIIVIDSLCASMGEGLFVHLANRLRQSGASIDEVAEWARQNRLHVAHYVMADDLMHLHRGGRVSKTSAIAGSMLGIKPIIHVNDEGRLIPIDKIRGKKQALTALVNKIEKVSGDFKKDYFMISHADCREDAEFVVELMVKRFGIKDYMINYIGPVIGSHTGAGTIALFLMAEHR